MGRRPAVLGAIGGFLGAVAFACLAVATERRFTVVIGWVDCAILCVSTAFNVLILVRPPRIAVRPDGVEIRGFFRSRLVSWSALETDANALHDAGLMGIQVHGDPPRRWRGGLVRVRDLDVDPDQMIQSIIFYRDHPERRADIGIAGGGRPDTQRLRHVG